MKRAYIALFGVVILLALFASTEVMAVNPPPSLVCTGVLPAIPPTCCEFVNLSNAIQRMGLQVLQIENQEWPMSIDEGGNVKYKWTYQYLGTLGTGGQIPPIFAVAPLCSSPPIVTSLEGGTIITPGTIFQLNSASPRTVYFYTDKKKIDNVSFELKLGTYVIDFCRNIEGPVCAPPGISVDLLPCSTIVPMSVPDPENPGIMIDIKITKDCTSRCAVKVEQWNGEGWEKIDPELQTSIDGKQLKGCFAPSGDQACQECMMYSIGSPGCYTYSSGGVTYKIPRGCI